ncbi:MAG: protein translocase subunit SecF [Patescibacteria group bacterium]
MNLLAKKNIYFFVSIAVLVPGLIFLSLKGLKLSIDFTGGSVFEFSYEKKLSREEIKSVFDDVGVEIESVVETGDGKLLVRSRSVDNAKNEEIKTKLQDSFNDNKISQTSFETIGPVIGQETTRNALLSVVIASVGILLYIAYSFRQVPSPYSSFRFGVSAIIAVLHDAFVVLGVFSILGYFFGVEINSLFITALLTVIGFSVHDTIVVFDRIRENLLKMKSMSFEYVVNYSLVETLDRSVKTSLTVILTLLSLLLLGGESIRWFVFALLIGIVSGTYSSIFNASPILVVWENFVRKNKKS